MAAGALQWEPQNKYKDNEAKIQIWRIHINVLLDVYGGTNKICLNVHVIDSLAPL